MGNTDFFDDDLIRERDSVREVKMGPGHEPPPEDDIPVSDTVPVHELDLLPLAQRKDEINSQVAGKLEQLERLRAKQDSLEREKKALEQLRSDQEKYDIGKREMIERLEQCLISLEREEIALNKKTDVLQGTQKAFKAMSGQLRNMREAMWPRDNEGHREELSKGLAMLDTMRKEYHKALSRLESVRDVKVSETRSSSLTGDEMEGGMFSRRGFLEWFVIGLAFNLPLAIVLAALIVFLALRYPIF